MKRTKLILAALVLLLIPAAAQADDFSTQLAGGGGEGFASVTTNGAEIGYGIVTDLQNPTGATLTGPGVNLNLGGTFTGGSTSGSVTDAAAAQSIEGNPGAYTVTVTSGGGNASGTLQLARATEDDPDPEPEPETCPQEACAADDDTLCLTADRFAVEATFVDPADNQTKQAQVVNLTDDTGYFWFFGANNVELVAKVLDACALFDRFFVFAGGLTGETVEITVCDTESGQLNVYDNPGGGEPFESVVDTAAFLTCP